MNFSGPFAGTNPLVTHATPPAYSGKDDPNLSNPKVSKANPYKNDDPKKWEPALTILNRPALNFGSKNVPDESSGATWTYDVSAPNQASQVRPVERYSKEQLGALFTEPGASGSENIMLSHHEQYDPSELLTAPERGYKRGRDPTSEIAKRTNMSDNQGQKIREFDYNPNTNQFHVTQMIDNYQIHGAGTASHTSTYKNNRPDKTEVFNSMPNAYRPPVHNKTMAALKDEKYAEKAEKVHEEEDKQKMIVMGGLAVLGAVVLLFN